MTNTSFGRVVGIMMTIWILLGFANVGYDWFSHQWISPLSLAFLLALALALILRFLGKPVMTTKGMRERVGIMIGMTVTTLFFIALALLQMWLR